MISSHEKYISTLLALVVYLLDGLVGFCAALNCSLVYTSVANHVWWRKVVHQELELALLDALAQLICNAHGAHCRLEVVSGDPRRGNHVALFAFELLLDATIEEKSNMCVLLRLSDVALLNALLAEPLSQHIVHSLWRECSRESILGVVLGHGREVCVLGIREIRPGRSVEIAQKLSKFADTV